MNELVLSEIEQVSGGMDSDVGWATSVGAAVAFVGIAATVYVSAPIMGVAFAGASIESSGLALDFKGGVDLLRDFTKRRG